MAKSTRRKSASKSKPKAEDSGQSKKVSEKEIEPVAEEAVAEEPKTEESPSSNEPEETTPADQPAYSPKTDPSISEVNTETTLPEENSVPEEKEETEGKIETISQEDQENNESMPVEEDTGSDGGSGVFKKIILRTVVLLVVFLLGMAVGGLIVYRIAFVSSNPTVETEKAVDLKESEESLPTLTPTEVPVDLTKYKIEVLNGSEVKGAAGELNDVLSDEGFSVLSPGNATSSSFAKTVVSAKGEVDEQFLKTLKDFLSESYTLVVDQDLDIDSGADVVVTIGAE